MMSYGCGVRPISVFLIVGLALDPAAGSIGSVGQWSCPHPQLNDISGTHWGPPRQFHEIFGDEAMAVPGVFDGHLPPPSQSSWVVRKLTDQKAVEAVPTIQDWSTVLLSGDAVVLSPLPEEEVRLALSKAGPKGVLINKVEGRYEVSYVEKWTIHDTTLIRYESRFRFDFVKEVRHYLDRLPGRLVILDWGCGQGQFLVDADRVLREAGVDMNRIQLVGYSDRAYKEWNRAPASVSFIWAHANDLPRFLSPQSVCMMVSNRGLGKLLDEDFDYSEFVRLLRALTFAFTPVAGIHIDLEESDHILSGYALLRDVGKDWTYKYHNRFIDQGRPADPDRTVELIGNVIELRRKSESNPSVLHNTPIAMHGAA